MTSNIQIRICEGSNPPERSMIRASGPGRWEVAPWQEYPEGTRIGLYHFRLDICFVNSASSAQKVLIVIRWPHPAALVGKLLDFAYILDPDGGLRRSEGKVDGSSVLIHAVLKSGVSWMSTNPSWHVGHNDLWFQGARKAGAKTAILGLSKHKRPLRAVEFGEGKKTALVVARMHPYESASSYCAIGLAEWMMKNGPAQRTLFRDWKICIVPLAAPDGVAAGCTRLTAPDGIDLNIEALEEGDATARVLKRWINSHRPNLFVDFHNWMGKTVNGLYYMEKPDLWAFLQAFDAMIWEGRTWYADQVGADLRVGDPERQVLGRYCHRQYRALSYVLEFPWHGSTLASMRRSGVRGFLAAVKAHDRLR